MIKKLALALGALAAMVGADVPAQVAQQPHKQLPPERYFGPPAMEMALLSPKGDQLAFTALAPGAQRLGLYVLPLDGESPPKALGLFSDADVTQVHWVNEERLVFSAVDRSAGSGWDQREGHGLYTVSLDGERMRTLIKRHPKHFLQAAKGTHIRDRALDVNHFLLHVPAWRPDQPSEEVVVGQARWNAGDGLRSLTPMWLNVRTGQTRSLDHDSPGPVAAWAFDGRGEPRLALTQADGRSQWHWRAPGERAWRQIADDPLLHASFHPHSVDDDGTLYVLQSSGRAGEAELKRFDFPTGKPAARPVVSTPGFDFRGELLREQPGQPALGVRVETDGQSTVWLHPALKRLQALADARLPGRINLLSCRRCTQEDAVVLVRSYSDRTAGEFWLYRAADQSWRPLARLQPGLEQAPTAGTDFQRIKARDGRDLPVWITRPDTAAPNQALPTVVLVHGGPWVRGGHWAWEPMRQFLASRGYQVLEPEFRGSTGYGSAHYRAGFRQWGQAMQDDVADALIWAQQRGLASDKACIAGASYGGYATLMGLVRHPELYRCGVAWVAVSDLELYLKGSVWVSDDISSTGRRHTLPDMVGDPDKEPEAIKATSPVEQAHRIRAPLLLGYGAEDLRVPLAHGRRLREAMQKAGNEPEWVVYPEEAHSWRKTATRADFARRMEAFLARHLTP